MAFFMLAYLGPRISFFDTETTIIFDIFFNRTETEIERKHRKKTEI